MASLSEHAADERSARVLLSLIAEADDDLTGLLLGREGAVATVGILDSEARVPGVDANELALRQRRAQALTAGADLDSMVPTLLDSRYSILMPGDPHWPSSLADLGVGAPYVLWADGATSFLTSPISEMVTFTGMRASTAYGNTVTSELVADLARDEMVIVSGGAYGIDAAAHRASLAVGGTTIAVLASGIDRNYPTGNSGLLDGIRGVGLVLPEQPPGALPSRSRFLARGRLLAALSSATVIPEAGPRSGSLRVADQAYTLGRAVGAVPGPITSIASTGPNHLIHENLAELVRTGNDVTDLMERHGAGAYCRPPQVRVSEFGSEPLSIERAGTSGSF